jgi:hypothetical protein
MIIKITAGALKNKYVRLTDFMSIFNSQYIGGKNKGELGIELTLDVGFGKTYQTDIDGSKKFFRSRKAIRTFFENYDILVGDEVMLVKQSDSVYALRPVT